MEVMLGKRTSLITRSVRKKFAKRSGSFFLSGAWIGQLLRRQRVFGACTYRCGLGSTIRNDLVIAAKKKALEKVWVCWEKKHQTYVILFWNHTIKLQGPVVVLSTGPRVCSVQNVRKQLSRSCIFLSNRFVCLVFVVKANFWYLSQRKLTQLCRNFPFFTLMLLWKPTKTYGNPN